MKVGQYCGELDGKEVVVSGEYAVLTFQSDDNIQRNGGFWILFSTLQLRKCNRKVT